MENFVIFWEIFVHCVVTFICRHCLERPDRKILCISNPVTCSSRRQNRPCFTVGQRSPRNPDATLCFGHVHAGSVQHLPLALPCHVHFRYFWHVLLHECQTHRRP